MTYVQVQWHVSLLLSMFPVEVPWSAYLNAFITVGYCLHILNSNGELIWFYAANAKFKSSKKAKPLTKKGNLKEK